MFELLFHLACFRKMQASFGWDIGPSFPSSGIYKPIFIEAYNGTSIQYVTFSTAKEDQNGTLFWKCSIKVFVESESYFDGSLQVVLTSEDGRDVIFDRRIVTRNQAPMFTTAAYEALEAAPAPRCPVDPARNHAIILSGTSVFSYKSSFTTQVSTR